jgi:hypothetical protein
MQAVLGAVMALVILVPTASAAPLGSPTELRLTRPGDHRSHPDALTEWWTLRAVNPDGRGALELRILREPGSAGARVLGTDLAGGFNDVVGLTDVSADRGRLEGTGGPVRVQVRPQRSALDIDVEGPMLTGSLKVRQARRGPAALGWRLGTAVRAGNNRPSPITLAWTVPVATGSADGTIQLGTRQVRLRRWRVSYEHGWGSLLLSDDQWDAWDQYVVHGRRADEAWLVHGLNRSDTVTGPGARDAQWLGVLARVDRSGVDVCRPRIHRRRWHVTADFEFVPGRLRASCRGRRFEARDRSLISFPDYVSHFEAHAVAAARGARGWAAHLGHEGGP